ncbi:transcriptional regulator MarR family [Firmicutes bacterium CAG:536]|nr:MarR family transcriptional regulator [Firmicutes bacterium AM41-11]CDA34797.1 transcriptional regulator MarR family [Firmicutes bacterium CAG:536]
MKKIHRYGMYFKRIHLDIEKEIHTKLSAYNLTKSQLDILNYLDQHPDQMTCQKDLQNYLHVSNATINGLVNRLEQNGYIYRITNSEDKRMVSIHPTEKANQIKDLFLTTIYNLEQKMMAHIAPDKQEELVNLLEQMIQNIESEDQPC